MQLPQVSRLCTFDPPRSFLATLPAGSSYHTSHLPAVAGRLVTSPVFLSIVATNVLLDGSLTYAPLAAFLPSPQFPFSVRLLYPAAGRSGHPGDLSVQDGDETPLAFVLMR